MPTLPDPIATLTEEHRRFLETTRLLHFELHRAGAGDLVPEEVPRRVAEFSEFLARDVDRRHGAKEERALFPALGEHLPTDGGPIGVMIAEHETLRSYQRTLAWGARRLERDRADLETFRTVPATVRSVDELLAAHIEKEDSVLFPMARELLSERELAEVARRCVEVEDAIGP